MNCNADDRLYTPKLARIIQASQLTESERLFRLRFPDGEGLGHKPGQFLELSVLGVGEAPITIASPPDEDGCFEVCVRKVGNVTSALHRLSEGDLVGIRGPLGRGFPLEELKDHDLLFVAGGIGIIPLRPVIKSVLARKSEFGRVILFYGMKHPDEWLFRDEFAQWEARGADVRVTVDRPVAGWDGHVGVVTTLLAEFQMCGEMIASLIVGPPVMYKFVLLGLSAKGLRDHKTFLSLERHMKCGLGKCGHCQINGVLVCRQGPTFSYAELKDLREALLG